jgi:protein associated with RNAse G/E
MREFQPGGTAVRRDVFRRKVWSAHALRVVEDTAEALVVGCRPGAESLVPTTWIEWLRTGDETARLRALPNLARGNWQLGQWTWRSTAHLQWVPPDTWFSVNAFFDATGEGQLAHWYVNFQRPMRRTPIGFDTFDLLLDLVVAPDLSRWEWKDEDEYAHGRRLGVVSENDHRAVGRAREEAVAMIGEAVGPFAVDRGLRNWRPEPHWPDPRLPAGVLALD